MLWQWSKGSKLRRSDWMHCLTYLDYSNSNHQRKKPCKLDAKNTCRLAHTNTSCQWQFSVIRHNRVVRVRCLPQPLWVSKSAARSAFHLLRLKTAWSVLVVTWTVGPTMRRLLGTQLGKRAVVVSCLVLRNVAPYTTLVPVKLHTQTVIY